MSNLINLKKIITWRKRGMDDTCATGELIRIILLKLKFKCDLGKLVGLKTL
jgi:hypothetical protein